MLGPFAMSPEQETVRPTTKQSDLFPLWMKDGESYEDCRERLASQRFQIDDDFLYSCITYGDGIKALTDGFTHSKGLGYSFLVLFVRQALGLYRLPYCEDRILSHEPSLRLGAQHNELVTLFSHLDSKRIAAICTEVRQLYEHTQAQLANAGLTHITITRRVYDQEAAQYAQLLFSLKRAADLLGHSQVSFEMDTLNSFGDDGGYRHFPVALRIDIPVRDVLYCSNLIASRNSDGHAVEDGEWVVLNRAIDGIVSMPTEWIEIDKRYCEEAWPMTNNLAQSFMDRYQPLVLRASNNQRFDVAQSYSGRSWQPTLRARILSAWRAFKAGQ